jgi:uncharacterized membrane protein
MKTKMKTRRLTVCCLICAMLLLLLPLHEVNCQNYIAYSVQINSDGSGLWKITNFSDVNASVGTFSDFQDKVSNLIDSASNATHRAMSPDENSLQINTTISSESKITEYSFLWQNFSVIQGHQIVFGDVFQVNDFFSQLYGDAALQISYPAAFSVKSVTPAPYQRDDSAKTLDWARTQDLVNGKTDIILTSTPLNDNSSQNELQLYIIIGVIVAAGAALSLTGFYMFKRRKTSQSKSMVIPAEPAEVETEEGKILKLLKLSGGNMRQSAIVDQSRFSKAKTSQLLTVLEKKGTITRYKKGRDKIVTLTERVKSE